MMRAYFTNSFSLAELLRCNYYPEAGVYSRCCKAVLARLNEYLSKPYGVRDQRPKCAISKENVAPGVHPGETFYELVKSATKNTHAAWRIECRAIFAKW